MRGCNVWFGPNQCHCPTVGEFLATGELIQLLPEVAFRSYEIYIFYRAYDYELPKIRAFVDYYAQAQSGL